MDELIYSSYIILWLTTKSYSVVLALSASLMHYQGACEVAGPRGQMAQAPTFASMFLAIVCVIPKELGVRVGAAG